METRQVCPLIFAQILKRFIFKKGIIPICKKCHHHTDTLSFLSQPLPQHHHKHAEDIAANQRPCKAYFKLPNGRLSLVNKAEVIFCNFFILHLHLRLSLANRQNMGEKEKTGIKIVGVLSLFKKYKIEYLFFKVRELFQFPI